MVYVHNKFGQPLMPTQDYRKVRLLLKEKKAKVVNRTPFTIQLLHNTHEYRQPISLGIDAGYKTVGISATIKTKELYSAEVHLRTDVVEKISTRRQYRRSRRNRKTRYRKPRFNNRRRPEGWVSPSVKQKIDTHLKVVSDVYKILPITKIVAEVAAFDIQKIKNPDIEGVEYQQGEQHDSWNSREYVLWRDGHKCQHCFGKSKDKVLTSHHIESRKTGGDAPNNLVTVCKTCHDGHNAGKIEFTFKRGQRFREQSFMGIMRWAFYERLKESYPDVSLTYGYITKNTRINAGLEKSHRVDARCISGNPGVEPSGDWFYQKAVRGNNRQIHKAKMLKGGIKKLNQAPKYVHGYQLFDKVVYNNQECFIFGRRSSGSFDIRKLDGARLSASVTHKKLILVEKRKTILTERRATSSPCLKTGVSVA